MPSNNKIQLLIGLIAPRLGYIARSSRQSYYKWLAILFTVFIGINSVWQAYNPEVKSESIDQAIKWRLSSPKPDSKILILDIDERSLAILGEKYGRWPWPREVLAEAIASTADAGAKSIVFNIMASDLDKSNPDSDKIFNEIAANTPNAVFPIIRLNPKNDKLSQVLAKNISGVELNTPNAGQEKIAVLFPIFSGTHDKLGINNLKVDDDGIVRNYSSRLTEKDFKLPSIALRAAQFDESVNAKDIPDEFIINWRNKHGSYEKISFADYYDSINGKGNFDLSKFKNAIVIIGATAPGISTLKGTPSSPITDDNVIIATAIDDILNNSYLRVIPTWQTALISILMIAAMAFAFTKGIKDESINKWFGLAQSSLVIITVGSASYTHYLVDLSSCFVLGLAYFSIAKIHAMIDRNASRGMTTYSSLEKAFENTKEFLIIGFQSAKLKPSFIHKLHINVEKHFGVKNVFYIDNIFGEANLLADICNELQFFIIFPDHHVFNKADITKDSITKILSKEHPLINTKMEFIFEEIQHANQTAIKQDLSQALLTLSSRLIQSK